MANDPKFARVSNTKTSLKRAVEEISRDTRASDSTPVEIRLNKYIAECGIASRRAADEMISEGAVVVNGKKVYELGTKVRPSIDRITVSGKPIKPTTHKVYILFNKPKNVVTTMEDPEGRPAIADYFERLPVRVFPVGRLDWDSEGMILLTNDGEFAQKVNHPSEEILKTYMVKVNGHPTPDQLDRLRRGISIVGGKVSARGAERVRRGDSDKYDWVKIMIAEGKNRQIRRMFEKIGFDVLKLQRVAIGRLRMPTALKRGEYLFLTYAGIEKIFQQDREEEDVKPKATSAKREARNELSRTEGAGGRSNAKARPKKTTGASPKGGSKRGEASGRTLSKTRPTSRSY